jgi:hypothetical protein
MSSLLSQKLSYVPVYEATSTTSLAGYDTTRGTSRRGRSLVERCVYQANEACVILYSCAPCTSHCQQNVGGAE